MSVLEQSLIIKNGIKIDKLTTFIKQSIPKNIITMTTLTAAPNGFGLTNSNNGAIYATNNQATFLKNTSITQSSDGGHTHTPLTNGPSMSASEVGGTVFDVYSGVLSTETIHTHVLPSTLLFDVTKNTPELFGYNFMYSTVDTLKTFPVETVFLYGSDSIPAGFTRLNSDDRIIKSGNTHVEGVKYTWTDTKTDSVSLEIAHNHRSSTTTDGIQISPTIIEAYYDGLLSTDTQTHSHNISYDMKMDLDTIALNTIKTDDALQGPVNGLIAFWNGTIDTIPIGWYLANGTNGTTNVLNRYIIGRKFNISDAANDVVFSGATITSTNLNFGLFDSGDIITVTGSTSNNTTFTIVSVDSANQITVTPATTTESAGATVTIHTNGRFNVLDTRDSLLSYTSPEKTIVLDNVVYGNSTGIIAHTHSRNILPISEHGDGRALTVTTSSNDYIHNHSIHQTELVSMDVRNLIPIQYIA